MTLHDVRRGHRGGWLATVRILGIVTFCGLLSSLILAGDRPTSGGGASFGEEIGSLPCTSAGSYGRFDEADPATGSEVGELEAPGLALVGLPADIGAVLVDAWGPGFVRTEVVDAQGTLRIAFHGEVTLVLDRPALEARGVRVELHVGQDFAGGHAAVEWNGRSTVPQALPALGVIEVPVSRLSEAGLLDLASVNFRAASQDGHESRVSLRASGRYLRLVQRHH